MGAFPYWCARCACAVGFFFQIVQWAYWTGNSFRGSSWGVSKSEAPSSSLWTCSRYAAIIQLVMDWGLGTLWLSTTNPSFSSVSWSGLSGLSLISSCVIPGEVPGSSSDSSDSNVEFNLICLQLISRNPLKHQNTLLHLL